MRCRTALCVGLGVLACGPAYYPEGSGDDRSPTAATRQPARTYVFSDQDVETIIREVTASRQLVAKHTINVTHLKRDAFTRRLLGTTSDDESASDTSGIVPDSAFLLGFNFVPEPSKRGKISGMSDVLQEQVVGFYSLDDDAVFMPDIALRSEDDWLHQRAVFAHEVEHALQAQNFPKAGEPASVDEALAMRALFEGDAMVAMGATLGMENGAPVSRTLRRLVEVTKKVPLANITRGEDRSHLDRTLDLSRKRLIFPYEEGMMFAADLYRAGGFPLLNAAFATPPRTTEQILHPAKYLAGELPRTIAPFKPPAGYTVVTSAPLGELDTRTLLSRCTDAPVAERAAAGWDGDRYAILTNAQHDVALAWVTAWDTEEDAREMEAALSNSAACWQKNALGLTQNDYVVSSHITVQRSGRIVSFARGLPEAMQPWVASLGALVGPAAHPKPVSGLKIPDRVELPEPRRGTITGDVYYSEWLGLVARTPPGMTSNVTGKLEYIIERPNSFVVAALAFSSRIANDEQNELTFREVQQSLAADVARLNTRVSTLGTRAINTPLGSGIERTWAIDGSPVQMRMALLPICAGTGSIVILQLDADPFARKVLEGWVNSFRWTRGRNLVACDYLDPK